MPGPAHRIALPAVLATTALLSVALTGCVSPYVHRPVLDGGRTGQPASLPVALAYAHDTREAYRAKIIELGESERMLSNGLITLGSALIAAAASGSPRGTIAGGALIGGTAYSLGVFNTDKRRAVIYIAGMKALACAENAVAPLNFDAAAAERIRVNIEALDVRIVRVTDGISRVENIVRSIEAVSGSTAATQAAQQDVQAARQAIAKAISAQGAADQLFLQRSVAGGRLKVAVDDIDSHVLDAIRGTEGALQAVPQIIAGLVQSSQVFAPQIKLEDALKPREGPHAGGADERLRVMTPQLASAVEALKGEAALLEGGAARLSSFVSAVDPAKTFESLKACKVEGLPAAMTVDPTELSFKAKTVDKKPVVIEGGAEPYFAYVEGAPPGLIAEQPAPQIVMVSASDQTPAGTYRLIVQDKTRQKRQVVTIKVTDGGTTVVRGAAQPGQAGDATERLVVEINAKGSARVGTVDVPIKAEKRPDGKLEITYSLTAGSKTTAAEVKVALEKAFEISNRVGAANIELARGPDAQPHGLVGFRRGQPGTTRWGPVVQTLEQDQVRAIQRKLCLTGKDVDGLWGRVTQDALVLERARRGGADKTRPIAAMLTRSEANALLGAGAGEGAGACPP